MLSMLYFRAFCLLPMFLFLMGCSAQKEEARVVEPINQNINDDNVEPLPGGSRHFDFWQQYYVNGATIDTSEEMPDSAPPPSRYMIHLKNGSNSTLVIYRWEMVEDKARGTWLGVEFPSLTVGKYNLLNAVKLRFRRCHFGKPDERFDGTSADGTLTIEEMIDGYIIGNVDATIRGSTKSSNNDKPTPSVHFTGSFRIEQLPLDAVPAWHPKYRQ